MPAPNATGNGGAARVARAAALFCGAALAAGLLAADGAAHPGTSVTWHGTVARLLERRCVTCHGAESGLPPALDDYESARAAAPALKQAALTRYGHAWQAVSGYGDYANDPGLTPYEADLVAEWIDGGMPPGEAAPQAREDLPADRDEAPAPDLVLAVPEKHRIVAPVHTFKLTTGIRDDRWIRGWTFEPGNPARVRAAVLALSSGTTIGTWTAGEPAVFLPDGVAQRIPAGVTVLLTVYYQMPGGPAVDASRIGFFWSPAPRRALVRRVLPCGSTRLEGDIEALAIRPLVGSAGRSLAVLARAGRRIEPLGWFTDYPAERPQTYRFSQPVALGAGTSIDVEATHGECAAELEYVDASGPNAGGAYVHSHAAPAIGEDDAPGGYWCPMHHEVQSEAAGLCPQCGMTLVPMSPRVEGRYTLDAAWQAAPAANGVPTSLRLLVGAPGGATPVTRFERVHEQLLHLFVISDDLAHFSHVHPSPRPDGSLGVDVAPSGPSPHHVFADFLPEGGTPQLIQRVVLRPGAVVGAGAARPRRLAADLRPQTDAGLRVAIEAETGELVAGVPSLIDFTVSDAATGEPVADLQKYLGAWGHVLIVSADLEHAVHSHPIANLTGPGGPRVVFRQRFPRPGSYRLWAQFQRAGEVATVAFTVTAVAPR